MIFSFVTYRFTYALSVVLGAITVLFLLFHTVGGDPALAYAGKNADAATVQQLRHELGFDGSLWHQYRGFITSTLVWDWGTSWTTHRSVSSTLLEGLGASLSITVPGFFLSYALSLFLAFLAAHYLHRLPDYCIQWGTSVLMSISFVILILFFQKTLAHQWGLFPVYGWDGSWGERWSYAALPILIFAVSTFAPKVLIVRTMIVEELNKNYIRTARAKGVGLKNIYFYHLLRNILSSILTLAWAQFPTLITGSLLLESFFGIPGIGRLLLDAINNGDFPVVKALTICGSIVYITSVFLGDILNYLVDPRMELR